MPEANTPEILRLDAVSRLIIHSATARSTGMSGRQSALSAPGSVARRSPRSARHRALEPRCRQHTERAIGAHSEWSPGVLAGAFSGAAVRDCSALTVRDLNAVTERDVGPDAACWSWNESWTGCLAHWAHAVLPGHSGVLLVQVVQPGRGGVAMVRRRSTVRFRKGAPS